MSSLAWFMPSPGAMTPHDLKGRTKKFAVDIIKLAKRLPKESVDRLITSQLARSSTGTAAAYRAVCRPRSDADFIYKLGNAIEEADESALWLEILADAEICQRELVAPLLKEADELTRIFVRSRETVRARLARTRKNARR
jgi:four helix bundle protein